MTDRLIVSGILAFALLLLGGPAGALDPAQSISQYGHATWTLREGLLPGAPTDMAQTADGYLWIGTRAGVVRFDGVRFVPLTPPKGEELPSKRIMSLGASRDGSLWIGMRGAGLARWHDGHLTRYPDALGSVMSVIEDRAGKVWFGRISPVDGNGPLCEVVSKGTVCHGAADGVPLAIARQLTKDVRGTFWAVSDTTLMRWQPGSSRTWLPPGVHESDQRNLLDVLQSVLPMADGSVWVGAMQPSRGLGLLRLVDDKLEPFVTPEFDGRSVSVSRMLLDHQNVLWIGTQDAGLYRLHDGNVSQYRSRDGLSSDTIQNLFEDREGTLWVLTTQGVDAFRDLRVASVTSREGLSAELANAVLATHDGTVWIDAWHSLDALRAGKITSLKAGSGLPGEEVTLLFEDHAGTLWVGIDHDLTIFENGRFQRIRRPDGRPIGFMEGMTQDASGDIWATTRDPDALWHLRDRKVIEEIPRSTVPFAQAAIAADAHEGIWLALRNGDLGRYIHGQLETVELHRAPGSGVIGDLVADPDGSIIGSTSRGAIGWRAGNLQEMNERNGLPCNDIHTLLRDRRGALWLYASCGIIFVASDQVQAWWRNPGARLQFRVFDALDGAQPAHSNFFPRASLGPDGRLWFANASIVQVIDPDRLAGNPLPPPVHVEQITADRTAYPPQAGLRLPANTRDLEIDYTALSLVAPQKVQFRYKLEGRDRDWQDVGNRRQAYFSDLPPSTYRFRVIASNNSGLWNEQGATLDFSIAPAYWQTNWFRALCLLGAALGVWALVWLRLRQVAARVRRQLEERMAERERIARDLHDTLLQGVQGLLLRFQVAAERIPKGEPAREMLDRALERADEVLDEGRARVKDLRAPVGGVLKLPQAVARIVEQLAPPDASPFRITVEGAVRELDPIVREEVLLVAREALTNAFRHAKPTRIEAEITYADDGLTVRIRDDGQGIDPAVLREGRPGHFGLLGMRERAKKIHARLGIWSKPGAGTEVEIRVPATIAYRQSANRARRQSWWRKASAPDIETGL
jgi:signal transduction histidine kinase/ligand-binding sensor domain-containing protein